jgi:hypothetical protein
MSMSWVSKLLPNKQTKRQRQKDGPGFEAKNAYQAVTIYSTSFTPCDAAKGVAGNVYLAKEAPSLPLLGCPHPASCRCRYRYHADRRLEVRRDVDAGLPSHALVMNERRKGADRRASR